MNVDIEIPYEDHPSLRPFTGLQYYTTLSHPCRMSKKIWYGRCLCQFFL